MKLKNVSIFCLVMIVSLTFVGCSDSAKEPGASSDAVKESGRFYGKKFSIKLPEGWQKKNAGMGIVVKVTNPENTADIGVQIGPMPPGQGLVDYVAFVKSTMQRQGGKIVRDGKAIIDGTDAYWFVISVRTAKILYYCMKKENSAYMIIVSSDGATFTTGFEGEMREVAQTFRFE